jgi:hypothetical protein
MIHRLIPILMMMMMKVPLLHSRGSTMAMIYTHTHPSIISYIIWARVHSKKRIFTLIAAHAGAWVALNKAAAKEALKKMVLKIPDRKMPKKTQKK